MLRRIIALKRISMVPNGIRNCSTKDDMRDGVEEEDMGDYLEEEDMRDYLEEEEEEEEYNLSPEEYEKRQAAIAAKRVKRRIEVKKLKAEGKFVMEENTRKANSMKRNERSRKRITRKRLESLRPMPDHFDENMVENTLFLDQYKDLWPFLDHSWRKEVHPLLDGSKISMGCNVDTEGADYQGLKIGTPYDAKMIMEVPLSSFDLCEKGKKILIELVHPRYNVNKKLIKLTSDEHPTRIMNHKYLCNILHDVLEKTTQLVKED